MSESYNCNSSSYNNFLNFFYKNFDFSVEEFVDMHGLIIVDYLYTAQISMENADENFKNKLIKLYNVNEEDIDILLKYIKKIFEKYPKWRKRGNK